ncbi:MAG: tRNA(fMet)-specific endonuclease VapC [Verrucomicrobiales bacterium]|jgi:tRNA(fMet)-specific endonuclease VapC
MAGKEAVVLDTNIVVGHLRNPGKYDTNLAACRPFLPATVIGELYAGAAKSARPDRNKNGIVAFLATCTLLVSDEKTAQIYGDLWAELARNGNAIPTNDIWIAASAIQHGLKLITHDVHFQNVGGLGVESWGLN